MKRIYIPIFFCLLLTACQPSGTPDSKATIAAGVTQTLAAQTNGTAIAQTVAAQSAGPVSQPTQPPSTPDSKATIVAAVAQTLAAQQTNETAIAQTVAAQPTGPVSQPTQPPATATPGAPQMPKSTPTITSAPTPSSSTPRIMFTSVPPMGSSEDLYGRVEGVNPDKYVVAIYIRVGGGWWTKPTFAQPTCSIAGDGTWECPYATGGDDVHATAIRAYLIPIGYTPPAMSGGANLPRELETRAVARVEATR